MKSIQNQRPQYFGITFILLVFLFFYNNAQSQNQTIGTFPVMQGGFETGAPAALASATVATGTQLANWSFASAAQNTGTAINTTLFRSGAKSLTWSNSSTSATLFSPTATNAAVTSATSYVVQFYWYKNNTGSARAINTQMSADATASLGAAVSTGTLGVNSVASTTWTKSAIVVSSGSSAANPRYGLIQMKPNGGSFLNLLIDDFCVYPGSAVDVTAPASASAAAASSTSNTTVDITWNGLLKAGDGGGYVIVRSTTATPVTLNDNGIYGVGLNTATGGGLVVGIVDGVTGLNTFSDAGLTSGVTYYYSIFAVDKAFNYAPAATCSVIASTSPFIITSVSSLSGFTQYAFPSPSQTYTVSGLRLTGTTVDLSVSANFQLSLNNTTWSSTLSLPVSGGGVTSQPVTIYVRLNAGATGTYTGAITHNSTGASQVLVNLNGNADFNTRIVTSVSSMTGFSQVGATPSASQSYTVSGFAITDESVLLTASAGFQISLNNSTWSSTLNLPASGGLITGQPVTIYVRLNNPVQGTYNGTITHTCTGATSVVVTLNGSTFTTPSITASPATLSFGTVTVGQNSAVQSISISAILLSPSNGSISVTAPSGFLISTSAGSGFSSAINLNYTGGTLNSVQVYVMFSPINNVAYSGNISISGGTASAVQVACTGTGSLYSIGDFGSVASGNWSTVSIWRQWDGAGFNTVATAMPGSANNVWILSGTTVTTDAAERTCRNLFVAGNLKTNSLAKDDQYIGVYGSLLKMLTGGFIGDPANPTGDLANGISLRCYNPLLTVTGSEGSVYFSRMTTKLLNCNLVIDRDINLVYHGTTNQGGHTIACFPEVANSTITINAGKTLTFHPWSSLSTTPNTGDLHPARSFTVNVSGTIQMFNSPAPNAANAANNLYNYRNSFIYGGVSGAGNQFVLNVLNGGVVTTAEIYPNGSDGISTTPICWQYNSGVGIGNLSIINVAAGGSLNVYKVADFRVPNQSVTGGGTFRLQNNARIRIGSPNGISYTASQGPIQTAVRVYDPTCSFWFEGLIAQSSGDGMKNGISGLVVNNVYHVTLNDNAIASDSLNLVNGKLILGDNNFSTNIIRFNSNAKYIVTNGGGYLKLSNVNSTERLFPIGPDTLSYNPAYVINSGTADNYSVKVRPYTLPTGIPWPSGVPRLFKSIQTGFWNSPSTWETETFRMGAAVNRSWSVMEEVNGGSNLSMRLQWNPADELPGFNRANSAVFRFNGSLIDFPVAPIPYAAAAGASPYTQVGTGLNSVAQQFGVASDTASTPSFGPSVNEFPNSELSNVIINSSHRVTGNNGSNITCGNFQLDGTLQLSSIAGDNMNVYGNWTKNASGSFIPDSRTVNFVGSNNATLTAVNGIGFFGLQLSKSNLSGKLTLADSISITKELNVNTGTLDLAAKNITLLSDANNTASVGPISNTGTILFSGAGRFVVERFINTGTGAGSHAKSWQLLCSPAIGQTIKQSWMENGVANSNPFPGYGTQIVGPGGPAAGFDMFASSASLKIYSPADSNYLNVSNTNQSVNNNQGYILFVRGDRSVTTFNAPATPTKLRSKGTIAVGNVNGPLVPAGKFQSVANPYPSAINYTNVTKSGLIPFIYVFDPVLSSYYGLGAYQTIELANGNATPGGTNIYATNGDYRNIQSGQAFFVRASAAANGSISFKEADKISGSRLATRMEQEYSIPNLAVLHSRLYKISNGVEQLIDGNKINFSEDHLDEVNEMDAIKLRNGADNFAVAKNGNLLSIENRSALKKVDTVEYFFQPYQSGMYRINFEMKEHLSSSNIELFDVYLNKRVKISAENGFNYFFEVNNIPGSKNINRFILYIHSSWESNNEINPISFLNSKNKISVSINPNPLISHQLCFELSEKINGTSTYSILNSIGQKICSGFLPTVDEHKKVTLTLPEKITSGNYFLQIDNYKTGKIISLFSVL